MRKSKYLFVFIMLLAISLASGIFTKIYRSLEEGKQNYAPLQVLTSFYPVYIAALNVTGDCEGVSLANLSEPQTGCMHDYQLTPQDMIKLSRADLFLVNGGGIENFLTDAGEAYPQLAIVETGGGLELLREEKGFQEENAQEGHHPEELHSHGEENAHAWMDTKLYGKMVQNIAAALGSADPGNQEIYQRNADQYCKQIQGLTSQFEELRELAEGEPVVILHEAYAYTARELGMENLYCMNLDEERQISASETAEIMSLIKEHGVKFVFAEELYGRDLGTALEADTGVKVCYLDTMVRGNYEKDSYLAAVQKNIDVLRSILDSAK